MKIYAYAPTTGDHTYELASGRQVSYTLEQAIALGYPIAEQFKGQKFSSTTNVAAIASTEPTTPAETAPTVEQLLPCPFCGQAPASKLVFLYPRIYCINLACRVAPSVQVETYSLAKDAIKIWNTRSNADAREVIAADRKLTGA